MATNTSGPLLPDHRNKGQRQLLQYLTAKHHPRHPATCDNERGWKRPPPAPLTSTSDANARGPVRGTLPLHCWHRRHWRPHRERHRLHSTPRRGRRHTPSPLSHSPAVCHCRCCRRPLHWIPLVAQSLASFSSRTPISRCFLLLFSRVQTFGVGHKSRRGTPTVDPPRGSRTVLLQHRASGGGGLLDVHAGLAASGGARVKETA